MKALAPESERTSGHKLVLNFDDGRICMTNNAAERAVRGIAMGRKNWTFAGSDAGGRRAAAMYTLIEIAKLNGIDPRAWLADVLARLPDYRAQRIRTPPVELVAARASADRSLTAALTQCVLII